MAWFTRLRRDYQLSFFTPIFDFQFVILLFDYWKLLIGYFLVTCPPQEDCLLVFDYLFPIRSTLYALRFTTF
jgi:hypothetical protein